MIKRIFRRIYRTLLPPPPKSAFTAEMSIGEGTYGIPNVLSWNQNTRLSIGRYCSIAEGVTILLGGEHRTNMVTTYPFRELFDNTDGLPLMGCTKGDVIIGNDVWIGYGALILSGITIGNGAIIAAGSVVTKDVNPYAIMGGNPARLIRYRMSESMIDAMQTIAWWDWPSEKIRQALPLMLSDNIELFMETYSHQRGHSLNGDMELR